MRVAVVMFFDCGDAEERAADALLGAMASVGGKSVHGAYCLEGQVFGDERTRSTLAELKRFLPRAEQ